MPPLTLALVALTDQLDRLLATLHVDAALVISKGGSLLVVWLFAWVALRLVHVAARRIEQAVDDGDPSTDTAEEKRGRTISALLRTVGRVVIIGIGLLLSANVFVNIGPLLAGAGILGLAVSFGAQSLVKDVISGFFILIENQFAIGDVIEAGGKSGVVERMSLRIVTLRDNAGTVHMIPNGEIKVVSNMTRGWSRAVIDVSVAYEEDVDHVLGVVQDELARLAADPLWAPLLDGPPELVGVETLADNAVVIRALIRTKPGKHWAAGREFRRRIKVRLDHEKIGIPYQKRHVQVHVKGAPEPMPPDEIARAAGGSA